MKLTFLAEKCPKIYSFLTDPKWKQVRGVALFVLITLVIHFCWRFWAYKLSYYPVGKWMDKGEATLAIWVFNQSSWIISHIFRINITIEGQIMWFKNGSGVSIGSACSGLKQIMQFVLLLIIYPGPWKHKSWFIPLGIILIYLTNLARVSGMAITAIISPERIRFIHDTILRTMFYVVIFVLWWIWVEKIVSPSGMQDAGFKMQDK
jgi:exosortase/archaeosortase family protein